MGTLKDLATQVEIPIIAAPMFLVSGVDLTIAVSRAGGIGSFPALNARTAELLREWLGQVTAALTDGATGFVKPYAVNIVLRSPIAQEQLAVCEEYKVPLIITSVGDPTDFVQRVHGWGGLVVHDVTNMRYAEKAIGAGVDGLILVCAGSGGHSGTASPFAFAEQIKARFDCGLIIGGGIGHGASIAAVRALGADFAYMGTRFIATPEALAPDAYKAMLLSTDITDIVYTDSISGLPANFIRQSIEAAGLDPANLPPRLAPVKPDLPNGIKAWKTVWSAGHGVGSIEVIEPASVIMADLKASYSEAIAILRR